MKSLKNDAAISCHTIFCLNLWSEAVSEYVCEGSQAANKYM